MAMTKKEKEAMQAAIDRADLIAALRWTSPVPFDVAPPDSLQGGYVEGWTYNAFTGRVQLEWSGAVLHGSGSAPASFAERAQRSAAQGAQRMYSTKAKALAALRHEVERGAAKRLLDIDRQIAQEDRD